MGFNAGCHFRIDVPSLFVELGFKEKLALERGCPDSVSEGDANSLPE